MKASNQTWYWRSPRIPIFSPFPLVNSETDRAPSPKALHLNLGRQTRVAAPATPALRSTPAWTRRDAQVLRPAGRGEVRGRPTHGPHCPEPERPLAHLAPPGVRGPEAWRSAPTRPAAALPAPGPRPCRPQPLSGSRALSLQLSCAPPPGACASSTRPSSPSPVASPLLSRRGGRAEGGAAPS